MIYAIARLNILGMLSILIEKTERSDTTNLQFSIPARPGQIHLINNILTNSLDTLWTPTIMILQSTALEKIMIMISAAINFAIVIRLQPILKIV